MKAFLIIFITYYLIGCGSSEFTITHKDLDDNKNVYIYLESPSIENISTYKMAPRECIKVTENQFSDLIVVSGDEINQLDTIACSNEDKCSPNNYEIVDDGFLFDSDVNYTMSTTEQANTSNTCTSIEKWMKNKEAKSK